MLKQTRWKPDTCGCDIVLEWDTDAPDDTRQHTAKTAAACPDHASLTTAPVLLQSVLDENTGKNKALAALLAHAPDVSPKDIAFRFDASRALILTVTSLTPAKRAAAQAAIRAATGNGKVVVE